MTDTLHAQLEAALAPAYQLERELGGGGMSRVFVARESRLDRRVVVKVLSPDLALEFSSERFEREIRTAAALQQADVVPVLSARDAEGIPFYIMPYVDGESLRARLGRGSVPIAEVVSILRDVARALAYAHARGIVHRDIKPDNVLLSGGAAVVTDFGIAKAISASRTADGGQTGETLTQAGISLGTPAYMAPEQAAGDSDVDQRADLYAFGCMAYELLAGRPPFVSGSPRALLVAHMSETPRDVRALRADVPPALAEMVMRCLAKEPAGRPSDARALLEVLDRALTTEQPIDASQPASRTSGLRAVAIYVVVGAVVAAVSRVATTAIGLPDWGFPSASILVAAGLPVVLWTAFAQRVARQAAAAPTTPRGSPVMATGAVAALALRAAPQMTWRRTVRGGALALGLFALLVTAFLATRAMGIGPAATLQASGTLSARDRIVMADFSATSGDSSLGRVVSFAVRTVLEQSDALTLVPATRVSGTLDLMGAPQGARLDLPLARQVAAREGAKAVIDGEVATVGSGHVLTIRLLTADSARVLASFQEAGDGPKGLIDAADKVARKLRAKAGESLKTVQGSEPLSRARTASLAALKSFSQGVYYHQVNIDVRRAINAYREAIARDSLFAEAWRRLGAIMGNIGPPTFARSQIDSALVRAYALRDRLSDSERAQIEGTYFGMSTGATPSSGPGRDRTKAIAAYRVIGAFNLGLQYESRRDFVRAASVYRAHSRDTSFFLPRGNLHRVLLGQGRLAAADSNVAMTARYFGDRATIDMRISLLHARGRFDELERIVDSLVASDIRRRGLRAEYDLLRGRPERWRVVAHSQFDQSDSVAGRPSTHAERVRAARILQQLGSPAASREWEEVERYLATHPTVGRPDIDRPDLQVATELAFAGRVAGARRFLESYLTTVRDTSVRRWHLPLEQTARGAIALAEGKYTDAVQLFRRGDSLPDGPATNCTICLSLLLARAFDAAKMSDSAIV